MIFRWCTKEFLDHSSCENGSTALLQPANSLVKVEKVPSTILTLQQPQLPGPILEGIEVVQRLALAILNSIL